MKSCVTDTRPTAFVAFDDDVDNSPDHLPISDLKLCNVVSDSVLTCDKNSKDLLRSKLKIHWSKFPSEIINRMYKSPLLFDFEKYSISSFIDFVVTVYKITELLIGHWLTLADTHLKPSKRKNKFAFYVKLQMI